MAASDNPDLREPMTLRQAAAELGVHPDTLRAQIHRGRLRAVKLGRDWIVEREEVATYRRVSLKARQGQPNTGGASH